VALLDECLQFEAVGAGHLVVADDTVELVVVEGLEGVLGVGRPLGVHAVFVLEGRGGHLGEEVAVVDDEHAERVGPTHRRGLTRAGVRC
jgi:hypothetical protein